MQIEVRLSINDRVRLRSAVMGLWSHEPPGSESVHVAYRYNVEQLRDGSRIYLSRPGRKHHCHDMVVRCEGFLRNRRGPPTPPGVGHLISELRELIGNDAAKCKELRQGLERVWRCEDVDQVLASLNGYGQDNRVERVFKLAKWIFIEQDLTYWNSSGRQRPMKEIQTALGWTD